MQHELPTINFVAEAEVRSKAEHGRAEEILELLRPILNGWAAKFHRRKLAILHAVQAPRNIIRGPIRRPRGAPLGDAPASAQA